MSMKNVIFCNATPYGLLEICRRFVRTCYLTPLGHKYNHLFLLNLFYIFKVDYIQKTYLCTGSCWQPFDDYDDK